MPSKSKSLFATILFLMVSICLLSWNLNTIPLFEPDEGRYSDMALTMVQSGDWLIPKMNHITHLHKPPFSSWLVAGSFSLLGVSEGAARLPGVILSLSVLLLLIPIGKFLFDFKSGLYSSWILLTSILYVVTSRLVTTDMTLTFLTVAAMTCFLHLFFSDRHRLFYFYSGLLALALAMLTKGPVAWIITLLPILIFSIWKKKRLHIPAFHWFLGSVLFLGISLSWYLVVIAKNPSALDYFLNTQLLGRLKGGTGHKHAFYYFLIVLPLGMLPWSLSIPSAISWGLQQGKENPELRDKIHFLMLWALIPFIFFSIVKTKLALYIVPVMPPLALLLGFFWQAFNSRKIPISRPLRINFWILAVAYSILAIGALIFIQLRPKFVAGIPSWGIAATVILFLGASLFNFWLLLKRNYSWLFRSQVVLVGALGILMFNLLPFIHFKNIKIFTDKISEIKRPGDLVIMHGRYYASMPFYLEDRVVSVGIIRETHFEDPKSLEGVYWTQLGDIYPLIEGEKRIFAVSSNKAYESIKRHAKKPTYTVLERGKYVLFSNQPESRI